MMSSKNKIKLAPRLRWGVGRDTNQINFFKISGGIFMILSAALIIRAGWLLFSDPETTTENSPQVLGQTDEISPSDLFVEYQIQPGETLFSIAKNNDVEWTMLATINNLKAPFILQVGQKLKIPKK